MKCTYLPRWFLLPLTNIEILIFLLQFCNHEKTLTVNCLLNWRDHNALALLSSITTYIFEFRILLFRNDVQEKQFYFVELSFFNTVPP